MCQVLTLAPVVALEASLAKTGLAPADVNAVAAQAVAVTRAAELDPDKYPPCGARLPCGIQPERPGQS